MPILERRRIVVHGVVQGVGFRPFVHALAVRYGLAGFVSNDSRGVTVEVEGPPALLASFQSDLQARPPVLARIESVSVESLPPVGHLGFAIQASEPIPGESTPISPDIATCSACLAELFDPSDRRFRYPFLNCTDCGPRFTIVRDIPYDRPNTTMAGFQMCSACEREYYDPANRRFHAQPTACPVCGPALTFQPGGQTGDAALQAAKHSIAAGQIVALKGIGGFHLACDAASDRALAELRRRKGRVDKPFAVMARCLDDIEKYAWVNDQEAQLLLSRERPIVLLRAKNPSSLSSLIAPGNLHLGFFLPYSPLHHLFVDSTPLIMTSGNLSDEPIVYRNQEALERLSGLADAFLLHDREIHVPCDDSVSRVFEHRELPIRRSRGYAPLPIALPAPGPAVLAAGGELKATLCLTRGDHAFMSQHIGDMENVETLGAFERACEHLSTLFRITPERIACDLHPGYLSTRWATAWAARKSLPLFQVQHHHAHVASLMAESGLDGSTPVIGVCFDGTGYGTDGAIWGGELLLAGFSSFRRLGHLKYIPLPGGDSSIKRPCRMSLAHLHAAGLPWSEELPCVQAASPAEQRILRRQLLTGFQCVPTSSMGRLFDAAASLLGVRQTVTYEAQGAIELEALADERVQDHYHFDIHENEAIVFDPASLWRDFLADLRSGVERSVIAARFHRAVARLIVETCVLARQKTGINAVALTGGVFQNVLLLASAKLFLQEKGFRVLTHTLVPPNDGGLALGQALIAQRAAKAPAP